MLSTTRIIWTAKVLIRHGALAGYPCKTTVAKSLVVHLVNWRSPLPISWFTCEGWRHAVLNPIRIFRHRLYLARHGRKSKQDVQQRHHEETVGRSHWIPRRNWLHGAKTEAQLHSLQVAWQIGKAPQEHFKETVAVAGRLLIGLRLRFHSNALKQLASGLAFYQQAADELEGNHLGGAAEEVGLGAGWVLMAVGVALRELDEFSDLPCSTILDLVLC